MKYMMLRDSIQDVGILIPLLVRYVDPLYEVVGGNHRLEIAHDLRIDILPCNICDIPDSELLRIQFIESANQIEHDPVDYFRGLQKLVHSGDYSVEEVARKIHVHPDWVRKLLSLNYLCPNAKKLLDKRILSCKLGIELARLPVDRQEILLSLHSGYPAADYLELLRDEVRNFRYGRKLDRAKTKAGIKPSFRQFRKVLNEYLTPTEKASVLLRAEASNASQGWDACIAFVLMSDAAEMEKKLRRQELSDANTMKKTLLRNLELNRRKENER